MTKPEKTETKIKGLTLDEIQRGWRDESSHVISRLEDQRNIVLGLVDRLRESEAARADLLAALKDLLHELDTDDIGGLVEGQMERARALIAKANASSDRPEA